MSVFDLPAPSSSTSTIGPIIGVVDGSDAAPGEVGEFLTSLITYAYLGYPTKNETTLTPINMPPGDWDLSASASFTTTTGSVLFELVPIPTGMSNAMVGWIGDFGPPGSMATDVEDLVLIGQIARGSFAVNTPLAFDVQVDQGTNTSLLGGTMTMRIEARRRR
jgi:hypothetical protein